VLSSGFPAQFFYVCHISTMPATCLAHVILLDLITLIISGEQYKLWSSPLCSFLHTFVSFFSTSWSLLLSVRVVPFLLYILISVTLSPCCSLSSLHPDLCYSQSVLFPFFSTSCSLLLSVRVVPFLLYILFSVTLSSCCSFAARTKGKITILYIVILFGV
jgi:hypothetical protein